MADDDLAGDLARDIERYIQEHLPKGVNIPTGVSEDEAVRAVKEQFEQAGIGFTDEEAREIVHQAWRTGSSE